MVEELCLSVVGCSFESVFGVVGVFCVYRFLGFVRFLGLGVVRFLWFRVLVLEDDVRILVLVSVVN